MKYNYIYYFYSLLFISILSFCSNTTFSQNGYSLNDYSLQLSSGKWEVKENAIDFIKKRNSLSHSRLEGLTPIVIQFFGIPTEKQKKEIENAGIQLLQYLPNFAYTAILPSQLNESQVNKLAIRAFWELPATAKLSSGIANRQIPTHSLINENEIAIDVALFSKEGFTSIEKEIVALNGKIIRKSEFFNTLTVHLPKKNILPLAKSAWVQFISPIESMMEQKTDISRNRHAVSFLNNAPRSLTGNGVIVGIWDAILRPHLDFGNRVINREVYNDFTDTNEDDHGNHVAGIVAGAGIINPANRGVAPQATLLSYSFGDNNDGRIDANVFIEDEVLTAINSASPSQGAVITQNSFGPSITVCDGLDSYPNRARRRDILARNFPFLTQCVTAGNEQAACNLGGFRTMSDATKNAIIVGSVDNADIVSNSSSFGPTRDGRIKPDISAMGVNVQSLSFDNQYSNKSGTSFAAPAVAGVAALLYERFRQLNNGTNPTNDLIKGLLCNNADDINNLRPDYRTGFGRLNALNAIRALEDNRFERRNINQGETYIRTITVAPNTAELKIMLSWTDAEASAGAAVALVNNLNLQVTAPDGTIFLPWVLNPANPSAIATRQIDNLNNIEQVTIDNPIAGTYIISVIGASIPQSTQGYALTWTSNLLSREMIFPQAGQNVRPSSTVIVNWQQTGATVGSPQTVEFSTDGGTNWTAIGTVNAPRTSLSWSVPNIAPNTQTQIRVRGAFTPDIVATSGNFNIMGVPTNLSATGCGMIQLSWNAVAGATDYDVFAINTTDGSLTALPNSPTTVTTINDTRTLQVGQTYWYAVRARSGTIVGDRSVAVSYTLTTNALLTVTNSSDRGEGSLREAIARACPNSAISFAPNVREVLLESSLLINKNLIINGGSGNRTMIIRRSIDTPFRIFRVLSGTVSMNNLTIQNGAVPDNGGGILNTGVLTLQNCFLLSNNAGFTGGAFMNGFETVPGANATLINCIIAFNTSSTAVNTGATIQNGFGSSATLTLQNCTITNNIGSTGRIGIRNTAVSTLNIQNTIINQQGSVNTTTTSPVISTGGNIIPDNITQFNHPTDLRNTDPRLLVFTPAFCSPAVNSGVGAIPATDIFGTNRIGITDRGAVEFTGQIPTNPTFVVQNGNDTGEGSLREAITCVPEGGAITFAQNNETIQLTSAELVIRQGLNITANGGVTIQRTNNTPQFRIFNIENTTTTPVLMRGINIANGQLSTIGNVNLSALGGGIRLASGTLRLENVQVRGNQAPQGAGVVASANTTLNLNNSFIINNVSNANNNNTTRLPQRGAGLLIENGATVNVVNSLIANNVASNGGAGIFCAGTLNLSSVTLAGNRNSNNPSNVAINNISAGLELTSTATLTTQNTIFHHPELANGNLVSASANITSNGGNLSSDRTMQNVLRQSTDLHGVSPLFVNPLQSNFDLLCYDATTVNPVISKGISTNLPENDIVGRRRTTADIGAYSFQNCPMPSPTLSAQAGSQTVSLSWQASNIPLPLTYEIYSISANATVQLIDKVKDNTFIIKNLQNGTTYSYFIIAVSDLGQSDRSNTVTARPSIVLANEENIFDNQLIIYPNPSEAELNMVLRLNQVPQTISLRLVSITGQVVLHKSLKNNGSQEVTDQINTSALAKGIYLLIIATDKEIFYKKVERL